MINNDALEIRIDIISIIALILTIISLLLSFNLSLNYFILSIAALFIMIASYIYIAFKNIISKHAIEIIKLKEKLNIQERISRIEAKLDILTNMKKRANGDIIEILIRIIQIGAIVFAVFIILKALSII